MSTDAFSCVYVVTAISSSCAREETAYLLQGYHLPNGPGDNEKSTFNQHSQHTYMLLFL